MSTVAVENVVGPPEFKLASEKEVEWYYHEDHDVVKLVFDAKSDRLVFVHGGKGHPFNASFSRSD
jgi:hypothetical protein